MKYMVELCIVTGCIVAVFRPKWLIYFLIFSLLEPSYNLSLGNYVVAGDINIKYYEITLLLIYIAAIIYRVRPLKSCVSISLIVFFVFALFSLLRGEALYGVAAFNQFRTLFALGMCIAIPLLFHDLNDVLPYLRFYLIMVILAGSVEFLHVVGVVPYTGLVRSPYRTTSMLSATQGALFAMPFVFLLCTIRFVYRMRMLAVCSMILSCVFAIASAARGVWIGVTGAVAYMMLYVDIRKKTVYVIFFFLLATGMYFVAPHIYIQRYHVSLAERFTALAQMQFGTASWRRDAWHQMIKDISEAPWTGLPFGTPIYFYVSQAGYIDTEAPHNEYLKIPRNVGLIGFGAFLFFLGGICLRAHRFMKNNPHTIQYYYMLGCVACFVLHLITAVFTQAFTTMERSPFVWGLAGIIILISMQSTTDNKHVEDATRA